jgi:DNA-binding NarL/FixJ family response regulator
LLLLDLSMPRMTGLDAIREIKRVSPQTKIVVLTVHKTEEYILATLRAGANGYVLKEAHSNELLTAIRHVLNGHQYLSPSIPSTILDRLMDGEKASAIRPPWETLTQRERQILKLLAEGYTNKEISDLLCISAKTVDTHRGHLMEKLHLHNVASLTALAAEKGLINK